MKWLNYYSSGFSKIKVKTIQKYSSVLYAKATQPLLPITKKKPYFKTSHVTYIISTDIVTAGTVLQVAMDWQKQPFCVYLPGCT